MLHWSTLEQWRYAYPKPNRLLWQWTIGHDFSLFCASPGCYSWNIFFSKYKMFSALISWRLLCHCLTFSPYPIEECLVFIENLDPCTETRRSIVGSHRKRSVFVVCGQTQGHDFYSILTRFLMSFFWGRGGRIYGPISSDTFITIIVHKKILEQLGLFRNGIKTIS